MRFVGVELYFEDLERAKLFYRNVLGLRLTEEEPGAYAKFDSENGFLCLERKGLDTHPSEEKAVVFVEVADLEQVIEAVGRNRIMQAELHGTKRPPYAVLHDPEGYNVILLQGKGVARAR